jgi:hypothetical protein
MHLIGINGFKRSGKNTAANFLHDHYVGGEGVVYQVGFADKVKIAGARALGYLEETERECIAIMDVAKERWMIDVRPEDANAAYFTSITGRQYLQNIGTEMRKLFGADFWVDQVLPRPCLSHVYSEEAQQDANRIELSHRFPGVDCVAITDLRFENEAERVLGLGGQVWRVERPEASSDGHDSEQRLPDHLVTTELDNSGSLGDLESQVVRAVESL